MAERTYKILEVRNDQNKRLIVSMRFFEDGTEVRDQHHAFAVNMTEEQIEAEVSSLCRAYFADRDLAVKNELEESETAAINEKADNLTNKEGSI